jgi:aldehyde dehydrogenase (NAD+)
VTTVVREAIYIDGKWCPSHSGNRIEVVNPATEECVAEVPDGNASDVDEAVAAASRALPGWAAGDPDDRVCLLRRLRRDIVARREEFAWAMTTEMGAPIGFTRRVQTGIALRALGGIIEAIPQAVRPERYEESSVLREPVGVVAAITPWNYPLNQVVAKVAAAVAAGCTVVLKPSELAPLSAMLLAEVFAGIDAPPGIVNLVSGSGPAVGEPLVAHDDVDMISFTGSTAVGSRVAAVAATRIKPTAMELGGKSATVVLPDGDLTEAVRQTVTSCLANSGQTCTALSRLIVPRSRWREAANLAARFAAEFTLGDPADPNTRLGPLVSARQRDRVVAAMSRARAEGAEEVTAGLLRRLPARGWFVAPAVFLTDDPSGSLAQEEVFGPVLCVLPYEDEEDAVAVANNSAYGL